MDAENKKENKVRWCQCGGEDKKLANSIKKGSFPRDTGRVCGECNAKIFEEIKK